MYIKEETRIYNETSVYKKDEPKYIKGEKRKYKRRNKNI